MVITGTRPLEADLILNIPMNEGEGTLVNDISGNRNHGTFGAGAAAPSWTTGKYGQGLNFGGDDYVDCGKPSDVLSSMSVFAWIKTNISDAALYAIIGKCSSVGSNGWLLAIYQNELRFSINDGLSIYQQTTANIDNATWVLVGATYDSVSGVITLYVNGVVAPSTGSSGAGKTDPNTYNLIIGARHNGTVNFFNGDIDEFKTSGTVFTEEEAALLHTQRGRI